MATVRRVPEVYATIQAAHDAAADGDTILLAPGTHSGPVTITKRVHVKGDTADPINTPCVINGGTAGNISYRLPAGTTGDLWLESITLGTSSTGCVNCMLDWPTNLTWRVNRCIVPAAHYLGYFVIGGKITARITNLRSRSAYGGAILYLATRTDHRIELMAADLTAAPTWSATNSSSWALYTDDHVVAPAVNYGPGYGEFYSPQWQGAAYRVWGQVEPWPGTDPSAWTMRIYRIVNGVWDNYPFGITHPNASTGWWSFDYLPTDAHYWVFAIPPTGYKTCDRGPFIPVTG